jgi:hypothetical protein
VTVGAPNPGVDPAAMAAGSVAIAASAVGDEYMRDSIAVARAAHEAQPGDATARQLAQSLTYHAERRIAAGDVDGVHALLREAAGLEQIDAPADDADPAAWSALATALRAKIGAAEPVFRPGR